MRPVRVAYLSIFDPRDHMAWSGAAAACFRALVDEGLDVRPLPLARLRRRVERGGRRLAAHLGLPEEPAGASVRRWARSFERFVERCRPDVALSVVSTPEMGAARLSVPFVCVSDAVLPSLRGHYREITALPEAEYAVRVELEQSAVQRAHRLLYSSSWAAEAAVTRYRVHPDRCRVIPLGANLVEEPGAALASSRDAGGTLRLLFVGGDWHRKGGDLAVRTLRALRESGVDARLDVIGCTGRDEEGVRFHGYLDRGRAADGQRASALWRGASFFLLPTRADCTPLVCGEASAYGLPIAITDVGGVRGHVDESHAVLFPPEADAAEIARRIAAVWSDPLRYRSLARAARRAYEERLNWRAWGRAAAAELRAVAGGTRPEEPMRAPDVAARAIAAGASERGDSPPWQRAG